MAADVATLLAGRLSDMVLSSADTFVLHLLSNSFLMGCDATGMSVRAHRDETGYHLLSSVEGSPTSALRATLRLATCILTTAQAAGRVLLLSLTPHYITGKCCERDDHITNFDDPDYRMVLEEAADNAGRAIMTWVASDPKCQALD